MNKTTSIVLMILIALPLVVAQSMELNIPDDMNIKNPIEKSEGLVICDHNADGERDLSDIAIFAQFKDSFDVNGDGVHDLTDIALYTQNHDNDEWCLAQQEQFAYEEEPSITVCDHNGDNERNLIDITLFAQCKDTFDANDDGKHDLTDIVLYAQNHDDNEWCAQAVSECNLEQEEEEETLIICDHNGDGERNLVDVSLFTQCKDTFDANDDGRHDLTDVALYAQNHDNDEWCAEFVSECNPEEEEEPEITVCDHNADGVRNLIDVGILAQYQDTFDVNGDGVHNLADVGLYAQNYNNATWCAEHNDQFSEEEHVDEYTITLNGANPQFVELGHSYQEMGASVSPGDYTADVENSQVNANVVGTYTVTYTFSLDDVSAEAVTRTVVVQDTTAPSITIDISPNNPDEDEEITITVETDDESDVDLEVIIYFEGDEDDSFTENNAASEEDFDYTPERDGDYTIEVTATDEYGNTAVEEYDFDADDDSGRSSGRSSSRGNTGDIRVIYDDVEEDVQDDTESADSVEDNIEINTVPPVQIEEPEVQDNTESDESSNMITGSVIGSQKTAMAWLIVVIVLIIAAITAIIFVLRRK